MARIISSTRSKLNYLDSRLQGLLKELKALIPSIEEARAAGTRTASSENELFNGIINLETNPPKLFAQISRDIQKVVDHL